MTEDATDRSPQEIPALYAGLPGQYLSRARESRGMSIVDIARTLKFSERQIEALERDDYHQLPGVTFIRGFIRSYARLLKLDPAPLIAMLEAGAPLAAVEVVAPGNMGDAVPQSFLRRYSKSILTGFLFLLVLVTTAYFLVPSVLIDEKSAKSELVKVAVVKPALPVGTVVTSPAAPAFSTTATESSGPGHQVAFDFDDRSWIEVKDATNVVVLTGEFPAHARQVVTGHGPFQLWVGNASVVRVTQDDRAIDLQPYTREGVARLRLE